MRLSLKIRILLFIVLSALAFQAQSREELSPKDRMKVFETVWEKINDKYYDKQLNGVDWKAVRLKYEPLAAAVESDEELYRVLKKMVGEMRDAHTRFLNPREAAEFRARKVTSLGFALQEIEGKAVVARVVADSEASRAGIKPGMALTEIDGISLQERKKVVLENIGDSSSERAKKILLYRRILEGEPESLARLGFVDSRGMKLEAAVKRKVVQADPRAITRLLPSGIGYIALNTFRGEAADAFYKAFSEIKRSPAIIIDLRFNGGGSMNEVLRIAGLFAGGQTSFGKVFGRSKRTSALFPISIAPDFDRPVAILVNEFSASGSELLASGLQEAGRAKIVGTQTCGCLLGISEMRDLKGGSELHVSEIGFLSAKGKVYEGNGVTPDRIAAPEVADLESGKDSALAIAEALLK